MYPKTHQDGAHLLGYEPSILNIHQCTKSQTPIVNRSTGEVLRMNECGSTHCTVCAPRQCLRAARHAAWALSGAPFVWSLTVSPVSPDPMQSRYTLRRLSRAFGAVGAFGYMFAVEQSAQTHLHALCWSDFDVEAVTTRTTKFVCNRVSDTYIDRYNVAKYLTKTVHRDNNLSQHLRLNGRLYGTSQNFWYGFLNYRHVRREYARQRGWRVGSIPSRNLETIS